MANMTTAGTSSYATGTNDTYTAIQDNVDTVTENQINGVLEAMVQVQTQLGSGTDLVGSLDDLVARLAVRMNSDGTLKTVPVDEGGTGFTGYTIGDTIYADGATSLAKVNIGSAYDALVVNSGATAPEWGNVRGAIFGGLSSIGSGSAVSAKGGDVTTAGSGSGNFTDDGYLYYTNQLTLSAGDTLTVTDGGLFIFISARNSLTINGTIAANGAGASGGAASSGAGNAGTNSKDQAAGGGGGGTAQDGGAGGNVGDYWSTKATGGAGGSGGVGSNASGGVTGDSALQSLLHGPWYGGAGGGSGGGALSSGAGGDGGATVILMAPTITLGASSAINTSGANGAQGDTDTGGGGGGGAGNLLMICRSYTDNGCTFTQSGGTGGSGNSGGFAGGNGANGIKQILVYN